MRQIFQNLDTGKTEIADVPAPAGTAGHLLIETRASLISAGTERMLVDFGKAGLLQKAMQQPDKVREVFNKVRVDGILSTVEAVRSKLSEPVPLGYCNVGVVVEPGGAAGIDAGMRVVSNGYHADVVSVPKNLCAVVPEGVTDEQAVFTVLGAIGLQGVRLAQPTLGESFVVIGLGLIGLMTVQILLAHGCRVLGIDLNEDRLELARKFGAEVVAGGADIVEAATAFSRGLGVDGVLITAATKSNEPVSQAARMCRKRGRIVLVGVTGLELSRADFYEKELTFQVSCSYGPGRYDPVYEEKGQDYPPGFVRWTEQRNFEAVLDLMNSGKIDVEPLTSHRFRIDEAVAAYDLLASSEDSLGIVLDYGKKDDTILSRSKQLVQEPAGDSSCTVGVIGAGNYSGRVLLPALQATGARLQSLVSAGGASAARYGEKFGFGRASTEVDDIYGDDDINTVVIATRHDTHAELVVSALESGKHVFVEKPLCIAREDVDTIRNALAANPRQKLMVGFNRRFAPLVVRIRDLLRTTSQPATFNATVNAGAIDAGHWTQDPAIGGGRVVGEVCHFVDLLRFLADAEITSHSIETMRGTPDNAVITLKFADGSLGTIQYLANGHKAFPKERLEVFTAGRILQLDNYSRLEGLGWDGFSSQSQRRADKGQAACIGAFVDAVREDTAAPIPVDQILEVSAVSIDLQNRA
jgi:predicted dehydrogenase